MRVLPLWFKIFVTLSLALPAFAQTYPADKKAADHALASGDYQQAITMFRKLVSDYPQQTEAINALGFALYLGGDFDEAMMTFERVLKLSPGDDSATRNLILAGGRRALESSYKDGLARLKALRERFPGHPQLAVLDFYVGKLDFLYGFTDDAFKAWRAVAHLRPKSGTAIFLKAVQAHDRGQATAENQLFNDALKQMPGEEVFRLWKARNLIEKEETAEATALLAPLVARPTLSPGVAIALSRFMRMQGQTLPAYDLLQKTSDVPEVRLERALMTLQLGASRETVAGELQKALDIGGDGAVIVLNDEPGSKVYLDGTLLGSPPLGLYPGDGLHEIDLRSTPHPCLVTRFTAPAQGLLLLQGSRSSGLDRRTLPSRGDVLL